jgi:NAD(P)-dependent dehydrogenase (short-subunit alcohol dehydrogenase family)
MTRSIVITGASKGIGRDAAEALATAGWEVIGVARHAPATIRVEPRTTLRVREMPITIEKLL